MRLSVALCTHNGEGYLGAQLASIGIQSLRPYELVICDDASCDRTVEIARRFASEAEFPVRIQANGNRLGSTRNFAKAISLCTGDVVVLADQDDDWAPEKLVRIQVAWCRNPGAAFVFSDAGIVDTNLAPMGYRLWQAIGFGLHEQKRFESGMAFESLLRRYRVTGATMAFRSDLRDRILPIPEGWVHDAWIALILSATLPCSLIPEPLVRYRQHDGQQHGGRRRSLADQFRAARRLSGDDCGEVARRYEEALARLSGLPDVPTDRLRLLREKIDHHLQRAAMRAERGWRLPRVVREAARGRYSRFGQGWKTIAQDLLLS